MTRRPTIYSIDTSALLHGWRRYYRPKNFGFIWKRMDALIECGRLRASIEVYHEIKKKDDEIYEWVKERAELFFVDIDDACQIEVARIMERHPRLVDTVKGRSGADPFVIALAATARPNMTVITEEQPGKHRIPDVCLIEQIPCIGLADFIEREDWRLD
ncbi:MAG: DUF4411 family protein [Rhodospirillaceae bacterium]